MSSEIVALIWDIVSYLLTRCLSIRPVLPERPGDYTRGHSDELKRKTKGQKGKMKLGRENGLVGSVIGPFFGIRWLE